MKRRILLLFSCFFIISTLSFAQADSYTGTWQMEYIASPGSSPIIIELQIAIAEKNILYPAHLKLQCNNFSASYELLLVRKSSRELAISKNKNPLSETPFPIGEWTSFLNGILDYGRDLKGIPTLTIHRIPLKQYGISVADTMKLDDTNKATAACIKDFLKNGEIKLKKINSSLLADESRLRILNPVVSKGFFGVQDTFYVKQRDGIINLAGNKKNGTDIVSVALSGKNIVDQFELNKKKHTEDILLDTGLNIITLFADNFGNELPNKGKLDLDFGDKKFALDFSNRMDSAATFIIAKVYYNKDKEKERSFQNYNGSGLGDKPLQKNDKLITSIVSTSQKLTLAIWDDAAEDGDSVSINIDGRWIVQGFPVKKNPQFITVNLKPGPNTITFIADNLGSIPPNTSVLEIIDGKKRKSFTIETTLGENNLIKILYDTKAGL